eukprot:scaffold57506_cov63-Cyclotella_meneghiniana.AAC.2
MTDDLCLMTSCVNCDCDPPARPAAPPATGIKKGRARAITHPSKGFACWETEDDTPREQQIT